jgi:two-component system NtrC family response regulator
MGRRIEGFSDDALQLLINFDWPGNVRQLKNVIERLVILAEGKILNHNDLLNNLKAQDIDDIEVAPQSLAELKAVKQKILEKKFEPMEKQFLQTALKESDGNITRAAEKVGMQRSNFSQLMKKHNLEAKKVQSGNQNTD